MDVSAMARGCREGDAAAESHFGAWFGDVIARAWREAIDVHDDLGLPLATYHARVREVAVQRFSALCASPPAGKREFASSVETLHHADLYLALACVAGEHSNDAWRRLQSHYGGFIRELARSRAGADEAERIADGFIGELFVPRAAPSDGTSCRLATYDGRGSLYGWLKVLVLHQIVDRKRSREKDRAVVLQTIVSEHPAARDENEPAIPPAVARALDRAIPDGLRDLDVRERLVLKLHYLDRLDQKVLARRMQPPMSPFQMNRFVKRAREKLRLAWEDRLRSLTGEADLDVDRAIRWLASVLDRRHFEEAG